jgi:hypothetical protein
MLMSEVPGMRVECVRYRLLKSPASLTAWSVTGVLGMES